MFTAHSSQQSLYNTRDGGERSCQEDAAFEIGIHDLELDNQLLEYFGESRPDLKVFVKWTFLGLEQCTKAMPVSKAYFDLKVTYCGPPSVNVCNYLKESTVVLELNLEDNDGNLKRFGEGKIDLLPALQQPEKRFFRCVPLDISPSGNAYLYCSFKQHNDICAFPLCPGGVNCPGCTHFDCLRRITPIKEYIEIGIGRLRLKHLDFPSKTKAPHIYVEYSILGYCGSHFETESEPKNDLLQFKHRKRLKVTEENAVHLEKMLKRFNPEPLTFIVLSEPCELSRDTDIEEIGSASLDLRRSMLDKRKDLVSAEVPVIDKNGEVKGTLSVTVLGIETLKRHAE